MRKVTQKIVDAMILGQPASTSNTMTDGESMYLHGHKIATITRYPHGGIRDIVMTLAGWNTVTTRESLNGLINGVYDYLHDRGTRAGFRQKNYEAYWVDVNGQEHLIDPMEQIIFKVY